MLRLTSAQAKSTSDIKEESKDAGAAATRTCAPPHVPTCASDGNTTVVVTTQTEYDLKVLQGTLNTLVISLVIAISMYAFRG